MDVKVRIVEFTDRRFYMMQWIDPGSGRKRSKSTKVERTGRKRERTGAERVAAKFEQQLRSGQYKEPSKMTWDAFRDRYDSEHLNSLADSTSSKANTVLDIVEDVLGKPNALAEMTTEMVSQFKGKLINNGKSHATVKSYLAHLMAALRWAATMGLLVTVPVVRMPQRAKGSKLAKGRAICREELDRMLAKVKTVRPTQVASWNFYLEGLCWWSGLRLEESTELYWDGDRGLIVHMEGQFPMLRIPREFEKGNQERLLPLAPEFCDFLEHVPVEERTGSVFRLAGRKGAILNHKTVGRIVSRIGKAAVVKVHTDHKTDSIKYTSAHDLRRSFGQRWSKRIMPADLMVLMRHESIETTMRYYVTQDAESTAATLWDCMPKQDASGNTFGNTRKSEHKRAHVATTQTLV